MTGYLDHPRLGRVIVHGKVVARRAVARWKDGEVHITVPEGTPQERVMQTLDALAGRILAKRPALPVFVHGQRMELPGLTIEFRESARRRREVSAMPSVPLTFVEIGCDVDQSTVEGASRVSRLLRRVASALARELLIPRARQLAAEAGVAPREWKIGRGARILGSCSRNRVITISSNLVFLPQDLRDYVVRHELAHLTEMNHSTRFHALCDRYCAGRERELADMLGRFVWPVMR